MVNTNRVFNFPVITLIALSFALGTSEFIVVGILNNISKALQVSITQAGSLVSIFAFVYAVGTPFAAALAGLFNRYKLIIGLMIVFILGNLLCALASSYEILIIARIIVASVSGTLLSVAMTFVPDISKPENKAKVVSWLFAGFSIASIFGVPIGTIISNEYGWRNSFFFITVFSIILLSLMVLSLPKKHDIVRISVMGQFVVFKDKRLIFSILTVFFGASASYVLYTYLAPIFKDILFINEKYISIALLFFGVAVLLSNLFSGKMAEKNGLYKLRFSFLAQIICMFILPIALYNLYSGLIVIMLIGFIMYLQNAPIQVNVLNIAARDYPGTITLAASMSSFAFNFGIAFGSFTGSGIVDTIGMQYVGIGGGVIGICALTSAILLYKSVKEKE